MGVKSRRPVVADPASHAAWSGSGNATARLPAEMRLPLLAATGAPLLTSSVAGCPVRPGRPWAASGDPAYLAVLGAHGPMHGL